MFANTRINQITQNLGYNLKVTPIHYDLDLLLDSENDTFKGKVEIKINIQEKIEEFQIDAEKMEILNLKLNNEKIEFEKNEENLKIFCKNCLIGENILFISYTAKINDKNRGFYISKYENKKMFSTHFEPSDARKAFPCFDHPAMKATFSISITAKKEFTILSNMPVKNEELIGDLKKVIFKKMPKTSTYLIAWVIGNLEKISSGRISIYSRKNIKDGEYALRVGLKVLSFFEKYFDIPYPLEKLDMVAIPEFSMGAMENWGLVTYRETSLLFNDKTSSMGQRMIIAETVAHELAHQWFGNLVTPLWWDDLWLNEGFATWAAALGCDAIRLEQETGEKNTDTDTDIILASSIDNIGNNTGNDIEDKNVLESKIENIGNNTGNDNTGTNIENTDNKENKENELVAWKNKILIDWKPWLSFINDDLNRGLEADILESSHPIKVEVFNPMEVDQIFDGISYSKSASLIRMIENYLTPSIFRKKLSLYLKEFAWKNATNLDLFKFLSDEENDIENLMNIWTSKIGFPLVKLENNKLSQTRMLLDNKNNEKSDWPIPIKIRVYYSFHNSMNSSINSSMNSSISNSINNSMNSSESDSDSKESKDSKSKSNSKESKGKSETMMIDFKDDLDLSGKIPSNSTIFLNDKGMGFYRTFYASENIFEKVNSMSAENRLIFVNDQIAFALSRRIKYSKILDLCLKFKNEMSPEILGSVTSFLIEIKHVLYDNNQNIIEIIQLLVKDRLNFDLKEEKDFETMKLRSLILGLAVNHGIKIKVPKDVHPMYLSYFYIQDFQKNNNLEKYLLEYKEASPDIQSRILHAIALTNDFDIFKNVVQLLLTERIKQQDKVRIALSCLCNLSFKEYFIHWFEENFIILNEKISSTLMIYIVEHTAGWVRDLNHFQEIMGKNDLQAYKQPLSRGIEKAKFRGEYRDAVMDGSA